MLIEPNRLSSDKVIVDDDGRSGSETLQGARTTAGILRTAAGAHRQRTIILDLGNAGPSKIAFSAGAAGGVVRIRVGGMNCLRGQGITGDLTNKQS